MSRFPSLPLWTDAWLADTAHLSRLERGTYMDLLLLMWRTPDCRVPNDDEWLGRRLRMTPAEVVAELRPLISEFCQTDGNWIIQRRLKREFSFVTIAHGKRSDAAKSRWAKKKATHNACAPTPTPTVVVRTTTKNGIDVERTSIPGRFADWENFKAAYPKREGANPWAPAEKAFHVAVNAGAKVEAIIEGAKRYAADPATKVGTPYVAQAVTWLHQKRWTDYAGNVIGAIGMTPEEYHRRYTQGETNADAEESDRTAIDRCGTESPYHEKQLL